MSATVEKWTHEDTVPPEDGDRQNCRPATVRAGLACLLTFALAMPLGQARAAGQPAPFEQPLLSKSWTVGDKIDLANLSKSWTVGDKIDLANLSKSWTVGASKGIT